MKRSALYWTFTLTLLASGWPLDSDARTAISGTVKNKAGQPLSGIALTEKGEIHNNVWHRGAIVDANGRFTIELEAGGRYGLHVYASGYLYAPEPVRVETGKTLEVAITLIPEPTRANDPVIKQVGFFPSEARQGRVALVKLDVADPNNDLGPQVMAFDAGSGRVYAMKPPQRVRDLKANFPQGVYELELDTSKAPVNARDWHFVVADHQCNTTDILSFPHTPKPPTVIR
jgi:hypothetical protein